MLGFIPYYMANFLLIIVWIILSILALVQLRRLDLNETARALWASLVVVVPLGGTIAFWIVNPGGRVSGNR